MKVTTIISLFLMLYVGITNAQTELSEDCIRSYSKSRILFIPQVKTDQELQIRNQKAIELVKPCEENDNPYAKLITAQIYKALDSVPYSKKAFKIFKALAKKEISGAATELGNMYKYGLGCRINFNKAKKWFTIGHQRGESFSTYALGYIYLKGLGNVEQDYAKAREWFKKSNHPMAKYWLGVSYYRGFGISKDMDKAKAYLGDDFPEEAKQETSIETSKNTTSTIENTAVISNKEENNTELFEKVKEITGVWKGQLLYLDWSETAIQYKLPVEIVFKKNEEIDGLSVNWTINGNTFNGDFTQIENTFYYDNFNVTLPIYALKKEVPKELPYSILSADFSRKEVNGNEFLVASLDSYLEHYKEKSWPLKLVVQKKKSFDNTTEELSDEALAALTNQKDKFIKLYPNPFEKDIIISYALDKVATTQVSIASLNGGNKKIIKQTNIQTLGEYNYYVEGSGLKSGMYVITVMVDNERKTRIVVKK